MSARCPLPSPMLDSEDGRNLAARRRMEETPGDPLFLAGWKRALFLHYEVEGDALQEAVPFALDLWQGEQALVSLVAFTIEGMRPFVGGRWTKWLLAPIATHGFLNVRTYVRHEDERGIFFLREYLPNRLAVHLGPWTFGLPYRYGETKYDHPQGEGPLRGVVRGGSGELRYEGRVSDRHWNVARPGTRDEFLLERYTAFTCLGSGARRRCFHVWHKPWQQAPLEVHVADDSLLRGLAPWAGNARLVGATYSPGVDDVWMGWPRRVADKAVASKVGAA